MIKRNGYFRTPSVVTSTAGLDIISTYKPNPNWTVFSAYKIVLEFFNDCTIKINDSAPIFYKAGEKFVMSENDAPITKLEIVELGVDFRFTGAY